MDGSQSLGRPSELFVVVTPGDLVTAAYTNILIYLPCKYVFIQSLYFHTLALVHQDILLFIYGVLGITGRASDACVWFLQVCNKP